MREGRLRLRWEDYGRFDRDWEGSLEQRQDKKYWEREKIKTVEEMTVRD